MKIIDICFYVRIPQSQVKGPARSGCYVYIIMQEVCSSSFASVHVETIIKHKEGLVLWGLRKWAKLSVSLDKNNQSWCFEVSVLWSSPSNITPLRKSLGCPG